jgi:hypothetical protein
MTDQPTAAQLEALSYRELQAVCKERNVKATG